MWLSSTLLSITVPQFPPRGKAGDPHSEPHENYLILFPHVVHIELNCSVGGLTGVPHPSLLLLHQLPGLFLFVPFHNKMELFSTLLLPLALSFKIFLRFHFV